MADITLGQVLHTDLTKPLDVTNKALHVHTPTGENVDLATFLTNFNAEDFASQTTLAAILAKIIAAPSTEAKQDEIISNLSRLAPSSPPSDFTEAPGGKVLLAGNSSAGFYGFVQPSEFGDLTDNPVESQTFNGDNLALALGLSEGTSQYSDVSWMKFSFGGKLLFVPVKTIRFGTSWNAIYDVGAVYGDDSVGTLPSNGRAGLELEIVADGIVGTDFTIAYAIIAGDGETLTIAGSASNDGTYNITTVTNTKITLNATLTPEAAGNNDLRIWNPADEVTQDATVSAGGLEYRTRLMHGAGNDPVDSYADVDLGSLGVANEWNRLILPLHQRASDGNWSHPEYAPASVDDWTVGLTDENLMTHNDFGSGSFSWCQEARTDTETYRRVYRGYIGASLLGAFSSRETNSLGGFRPGLELA